MRLNPPRIWRFSALLAGAALLCGLCAVAMITSRRGDTRAKPSFATSAPFEREAASQERAAMALDQKASQLKEPEALLQVGEKLRGMGQKQRAFEVIARAYDQQYKNPRFAAAMVEALLDTGQTQDARALATPLVAQSPGSGDAQAALAEVLLQVGNYTQAEQLARKAVQLAPDSPRAWRAFARACSREKRLQETWPAFERAERLAPGDGGLLTDYGEELDRYGQSEKAEQVLRRAAVLRPRDTRTLTLLGKHLGSQARTGPQQAEAIALLRKASELTPTAPEPRYQLGRVLLQTEDAAGAVAALEECLRLDGSLMEALLPLGQAYQAVGRGQEAKDAFARYSRFAELRREMAQLQLRLRRNPTSVPTLLRMAALNEGYGRRKEALVQYRQALQLRPDPELSKYVAGLETGVELLGPPTALHSHTH